MRAQAPVMDIRYPTAQWRPLSSRDDEPAVVPRLFIVHTMVGYLAGTESMFKQGGYTGTESTFGIGGPWDGKLDGAVYQWQRLDREADAQYDGNPIATSVETSDGGDPSRPWSTRQLDALVLLGAWWADQTKRPVALATAYNGQGFGYHEQFPQWNRSGHRCPGPVREKQYREIVLPRIAAELRGDDMPLSDADLEKIRAIVWDSDKLPAPAASAGRETNPTWKYASGMTGALNLLYEAVGLLQRIAKKVGA